MNKKLINVDYSDFILSYTNRGLEKVHHDLNLTKSGYKFLYILDTYDVLENYLPYTQVKLFTKQKKQYLIPKFICYDYFFNVLNETKIILPNEYKIELLAAKNKLYKQLSEAKAAIDNLESLKRRTGDLRADINDSKEFFSHHFEVLLLLLILNEKKNSVLDEFQFFVRDRLEVSGISIDGKENDTVSEIFSQCQHTDLSITLFKDYVENSKLEIVSISNHEDRHIYLENTFRDIQVIERIMRINNAFEQRGLKYYAVYISSANKTNEIFKTLYNNDRSKGAAFNRNIFHYFLFDKLKRDNDGNLDSAIEFLSTLKNLKERITAERDKQNELKGMDKEVVSSVRSMFEDASNLLDNHFYFSVYEKYEGTFKKAFDEDYDGVLKEDDVKKMLDEIHANRVDLKSKIRDLSFNLSRLDQTLDIADIFRQLMEYETKFREGKDIIKNPYQHLPVMFLLDAKYESTLQILLYSFLDIAIQGKVKFKSLRTKLKDILKELEKNEKNTGLSRAVHPLIIQYLSFIASKRNYDETSSILDFEKLKEIINASRLKINIKNSVKLGNIEYEYDKDDLYLEVCYVLLWLYRRNNREEEGLSLGRELISNFPNEFRIFHGIALCNISLLYKSLKTSSKYINNSINYVNDAIYNLIKTAEEMKIRLLDQSSSYAQKVLSLNFSAVLNSLADMHIRRFEISRDAHMIQIANNYISELKSISSKYNIDYQNHPTYLDTEAEILFYMASEANENGRLSETKTFIGQANNLINRRTKVLRSNKLDGYNWVSDNYFFEKDKKIFELYMQVFTEN